MRWKTIRWLCSGLPPALAFLSACRIAGKTMNLQSIAATVANHLFGRLLRRALLALAIAALAIVALYHFTAAGMLALESRFSDLHAQLIVAGIYTVLAAIALTILWAKSRN